MIFTDHGTLAGSTEHHYNLIMTFDPDDLKQSIIESLGRITPVDSRDIPDMSLYMDQVTTFLEKYMEHTKRYDSDKVLTKTMINNYAKNRLLPSPDNKKYDKDHMIMLILIYYFKNFLSITDIEKLMSPLSKKYFHSKGAITLEDIYNDINSISLEQVAPLQEFVEKEFDTAESLSKKAGEKGADEEDTEFLKLFLFICSLAFDAYVKRLMIEKLIDLMPDGPGKK